jgi:hypothetical protein
MKKFYLLTKTLLVATMLLPQGVKAQKTLEQQAGDQQTITTNKTWDFTEYATHDATTADIVCDDLKFPTGIKLDAVPADVNNGAKYRWEDQITSAVGTTIFNYGGKDRSLSFKVNGKGYISVSYNPVSTAGTSVSTAKKLKYQIGTASAVTLSYDQQEISSSTNSNSKRYFIAKTFSFDVDTDTEIKLTFTCTSSATTFDIKSIKVVFDKPTVSISNIGYATYCSPFALDYSGLGCKAYVVTAAESDGTLTYKEVTKVPANHGVLLVGAEGNYTPAITDDASAETSFKEAIEADDAYIPRNLLKPTLANITVGTTAGCDYGKVWVLGYDNSVAGFYKSNNGRILSVGKAYLYLENGITGGSEARGFFPFSFDGNELTGVENVEAAPAEATLMEGKFFENGKLVIFKKGMKFNANGTRIK